jgi:hypothetical protein
MRIPLGDAGFVRVEARFGQPSYGDALQLPVVEIGDWNVKAINLRQCNFASAERIGDAAALAMEPVGLAVIAEKDRL